MSLFGNHSSKMPHNKFPIVETNFLSNQFGIVTPFVLKEVLPGDRIKGYSSIAARFMPLVAPQMSRCRAYVHYYFVPSRILAKYDEYEKFYTQDTVQGERPTRSYTTVGEILKSLNYTYSDKFGYGGNALNNTLYDYMDINLGDDANYQACGKIVILEPFFAFFKMMLDHYVNTRTVFYVPVGYVAEEDRYIYSYVSYQNLLESYNTYCKGNAYNNYFRYDSANIRCQSNSGDAILHYDIPLLAFIGICLYRCCYPRDYFTSAYPSNLGTGSQVNIGSTIDDLRANLATKEYMERWARSGDTVGDWFYQFFKVFTPDKALNRSEFLGGGRMNLQISEVLQTSESTEDNPLGEFGGIAKVKRNIGFGKRYFTEPGWFIGVIFFIPQQAYYQGIPKMYGKLHRNDLYNVVFDGLGDEGVKQSEIYLKASTDAADSTIIGYQPRYLDYKVGINRVHGDLKESLRFWHAARHFSTPPTLDTIQMVSPSPNGINRIFNYAGGTNVPDDFGKIVLRIRNNFVFKRKMKYFGYPHL